MLLLQILHCHDNGQSLDCLENENYRILNWLTYWLIDQYFNSQGWPIDLGISAKNLNEFRKEYFLYVIKSLVVSHDSPTGLESDVFAHDNFIKGRTEWCVQKRKGGQLTARNFRKMGRIMVHAGHASILDTIEPALLEYNGWNYPKHEERIRQFNENDPELIADLIRWRLCDEEWGGDVLPEDPIAGVAGENRKILREWIHRGVRPKFDTDVKKALRKYINKFPE